MDMTVAIGMGLLDRRGVGFKCGKSVTSAEKRRQSVEHNQRTTSEPSGAWATSTGRPGSVRCAQVGMSGGRG